MSKRRLTTDEAVADILWFLDNENEVEDDDFSDVLDKIYDIEDLNAAQSKIFLMIKTPLAVKESVEFAIQRLPQKILLKKRWSSQSTNPWMKLFMIFMILVILLQRILQVKVNSSFSWSKEKTRGGALHVPPSTAGIDQTKIHQAS